MWPRLWIDEDQSNPICHVKPTEIFQSFIWADNSCALDSIGNVLQHFLLFFFHEDPTKRSLMINSFRPAIANVLKNWSGGITLAQTKAYRDAVFNTTCSVLQNNDTYFLVRGTFLDVCFVLDDVFFPHTKYDTLCQWDIHRASTLMFTTSINRRYFCGKCRKRKVVSCNIFVCEYMPQLNTSTAKDTIEELLKIKINYMIQKASANERCKDW